MRAHIEKACARMAQQRLGTLAGKPYNSCHRNARNSIPEPATSSSSPAPAAAWAPPSRRPFCAKGAKVVINYLNSADRAQALAATAPDRALAVQGRTCATPPPSPPWSPAPANTSACRYTPSSTTPLPRLPVQRRHAVPARRHADWAQMRPPRSKAACAPPTTPPGRPARHARRGRRPHH